MNIYGIYANATKLLCANAFGGIGNLARFNDRISRLYNKINKSQLTVYQKESLLQQLETTRNLALNAKAGIQAGKESSMQPQYAIAKSHSKKELLAA